MDCYFAEGPCVKWGLGHGQMCRYILSLSRFLIGHSTDAPGGFFGGDSHTRAECIKSLCAADSVAAAFNHGSSISLGHAAVRREIEMIKC